MGAGFVGGGSEVGGILGEIVVEIGDKVGLNCVIGIDKGKIFAGGEL